jgi:hypothetical protein
MQRRTRQLTIGVLLCILGADGFLITFVALAGHPGPQFGWLSELARKVVGEPDYLPIGLIGVSYLVSIELLAVGVMTIVKALSGEKKCDKH